MREEFVFLGYRNLYFQKYHAKSQKKQKNHDAPAHGWVQAFWTGRSPA
jgi:hypothetical protein